MERPFLVGTWGGVVSKKSMPWYSPGSTPAGTATLTRTACCWLGISTNCAGEKVTKRCAEYGDLPGGK
ncbi:hypothetical protein D3C87_1914710 [compost metagenome]